MIEVYFLYLIVILIISFITKYLIGINKEIKNIKKEIGGLLKIIIKFDDEIIEREKLLDRIKDLYSDVYGMYPRKKYIEKLIKGVENGKK